MTTDHAYLTILCVELKAGKFSILSSPDKKCSGSVYDLHCPESIERDDIYDPKKSGPFSKEELTARLQELADMRIMFNPWPEGIVPAEQVNREQSVVSVA